MASITQTLFDRGLVKPPRFVPNNVMYETVMGSIAYGVSSESSDYDVYGFCIPPKEVVFPHLAGVVIGFNDESWKRFDQYQEHHIQDPSACGGKGREYDLTIYNIVKFFRLCTDCNPNMIDSLFTSQEFVLHATRVGNLVRENRKLFLHTGCWHKFKGYAYAQLHRMKGKNPVGKRKEIREKFGFDVKFAYHVVRLLNEVEQLLVEGDLDLQRNREQLKAIRRGEMNEEDIIRWASEKERDLEKIYLKSCLPVRPDLNKIRDLLLNCLEDHYGSLAQSIATPDAAKNAMAEIQSVIERYQSRP